MLRIDDQAFRTDTGRQRNANEDSFFVRAPIFVVADGMGGPRRARSPRRPPPTPSTAICPTAPPERFLRETIEAANRRSTTSPATTPRWPGWGRRSPPRSSTPQARRSAIGHVGDSRAYRLRGGKLERLTRDHSLVEEMRRKGQITDAQAEDHPQRSIITRALGPEPEVEVDLQTVPAAPGDVFLICSDGLTTMLDEEQIGHVARRRHLDEGGGPRAGRRSQPRRRPRQHHRARLPARRRRRAAARARGRDADRPERRGGGPDRDRGPPPRRRRAPPASAARSSPRSRARRRAADRGQGRSRSLVVLARARLRRLVRQPPGLVPRHRRRRPRRPLPRPSLRTALRDQALRRALREPDPDRVAAASSAATRSPATTCARAKTPSR